jgi:hypothetical protein
MRGDFVVAVIALGAPVEREAPVLAGELGITAYEAGLLLRAPSPSIVLRTEDRARALALLGALRGRGHDSVACDTSAVVASADMHVVRSFVLDADALTDGGERLPWGSITALVRAVHSARVETTEKTTDKKISLGRAALTGGILATKNVASERTRVSDAREQVLYVFASSPRPWIVVASRARYDGLGEPLKPMQLENFERFVSVLRERCRGAAFDDRLLAVKNADAAAVDLLANVVALAVTRTR